MSFVSVFYHPACFLFILQSPEESCDRLAASLPSSVSDDAGFHRGRRSARRDARDMALEQPIPAPADYSVKYASRPLPQTPHSPSPSTSYPYNMSLARALDHNCGSQDDSSPEVAARVKEELSQPEIPANVATESNTRCIWYFDIVLHWPFIL